MESSTGSKRTTASYARGGMHALFHRSGRGLGDLTDRVALVTGASGGLGATIARRLHHEGAQLVLSGRREGELSALAAELGGKTRVVTADLTRLEDVQRLAGQADGVDILVANAGLPANGDLVDLSVEDIARAVDIIGRARQHASLLDLQRRQVRTARLWPCPARRAARVRGRRLVDQPNVCLGDRHVGRHRPASHSPRGDSPQVADACVEAIHTNRAETLVAPRTQRLAVRVAGLFPELMQPVLRSSVVPPEAVAAQQLKR